MTYLSNKEPWIVEEGSFKLLIIDLVEQWNEICLKSCTNTTPTPHPKTQILKLNQITSIYELESHVKPMCMQYRKEKKIFV